MTDVLAILVAVVVIAWRLAAHRQRDLGRMIDRAIKSGRPAIIYLPPGEY